MNIMFDNMINDIGMPMDDNMYEGMPVDDGMMNDMPVYDYPVEEGPFDAYIEDDMQDNMEEDAQAGIGDNIIQYQQEINALTNNPPQEEEVPMNNPPPPPLPCNNCPGCPDCTGEVGAPHAPDCSTEEMAFEQARLVMDIAETYALGAQMHYEDCSFWWWPSCWGVNSDMQSANATLQIRIDEFRAAKTALENCRNGN